MLPIIQLGPLAIQSTGLFILISIWIGMTLMDKRAAPYGIKSDLLDNLVLLSLFCFIIGGRLSFVLQHFDVFRASPLDLISTNTSLFDFTGGLAFGLLAALIFGQRKGLPFWSTLDALTPFFAALMVGLGLSHLASGNAFGRETSMPWGIELFGAKRHPSQIYETVFALIILVLVGLRKPLPAKGSQILAFVAWTAGAHLFLEAFRGDSTLLFGGLRQGQVLAWIVLALALLGLDRLQSARKETATAPQV